MRTAGPSNRLGTVNELLKLQVQTSRKTTLQWLTILMGLIKKKDFIVKCIIIHRQVWTTSMRLKNSASKRKQKWTNRKNKNLLPESWEKTSLTNQSIIYQSILKQTISRIRQGWNYCFKTVRKIRRISLAEKAEKLFVSEIVTDFKRQSVILILSQWSVEVSYHLEGPKH